VSTASRLESRKQILKKEEIRTFSLYRDLAILGVTFVFPARLESAVLTASSSQAVWEGNVCFSPELVVLVIFPGQRCEGPALKEVIWL